MAKSEKLAEKAAETMKRAGKSMKDMTTKAATNATTLSTKVIDHAEDNARSAFIAMRSAAASKSVQELAQLHADFVKEQSARSMTQVREVGELIAQFGKDALSVWRMDKDEEPPKD